MRTYQQGVIGVAAAMILMVSTTSQGANARLATRYHTDYRATPRLIFSPVQPVAKAGNGEALAGLYLSAEHAQFGLPADLANLRLTRTRESLLATHYCFGQFIHDIPVEYAEITVSVSKQNGTILRVFNNTHPVEAPVPLPGVTKNADDALASAWHHLRVHARLITQPEVQRVYRPNGKGFDLVDKVSLHTEGPFGHWELDVDATSGRVQHVRDSAVHRVAKHTTSSLPNFSAYKGPLLDLQQGLATLRAEKMTLSIPPSTPLAIEDGTAQVFDPNPVISLATTTLTDESPESSFTPAYRQRVLKGITENAGIYRLSGPWVTVVDYEAPATAPSTSTNGIWSFTRGTNAFNDAMSYFHVDQNQRYIQSLGFTNASGIQDAPISIDTDGASGADQSYYLPGPNVLVFGHGCVDDNEDADVILHEYGHAIQYSINSSWIGGDTGAMGEGFSDYWAASYRQSTSNGPTFHPDWVFTWDGHNTCWSGRVLSRTNAMYNPATTYQAHLAYAGVIADEYWSTPLFSSLIKLIDLGRTREEVDRIILEAHFGLGAGLKMPDMAAAIVQTAEALHPDGPHADVFIETFVHHNMLAPPKLTPPSLHSPSDGDIFLTNTTTLISWSDNNAFNTAQCRLEYTARCAAFADNMENGTNGWSVSHVGGSNDWQQIHSDAHSPSTSWFVPNLTGVRDIFLVSPPFSLEPGMWLKFWHKYDLEYSFDGGVVEISTNGPSGPFTDIGGEAITNGYDTAISLVDLSPIAGRQAFTGTRPEFIQTVIPLPAVTASANVRFRFATDPNVVNTGWTIDDVSVSESNTWVLIGSADTHATNYLWTLPAITGESFCVRGIMTGAHYTDSDAGEGGAFAIAGLDSDGDGILFDDEIILGLNPNANDRHIDKDGDRLSNADELTAGTDFNNASSVFDIVTFELSSPGTLSFPSVVGRAYTVFTTTNMLITNWTPYVQGIAGSNALTIVTFTNAAPQRYYRVDVERSP